MKSVLRRNGLLRTAAGALILAAAATASAQVVLPKIPKDADACKMLEDASRGSAVKAHAAYRNPASVRTSCEYTDTQDLLKAQWRITFGFTPRDSVARAQKSWQTDFDTWKRNEANGPSRISVSGLHGYGVDDAFIVEIVDKDSATHQAKVIWRKGIYEGTLQMQAPSNSHLADAEDAEEVFKAIHWAVFGK